MAKQCRAWHQKESSSTNHSGPRRFQKILKAFCCSIARRLSVGALLTSSMAGRRDAPPIFGDSGGCSTNRGRLKSSRQCSGREVGDGGNCRAAWLLARNGRTPMAREALLRRISERRENPSSAKLTESALHSNETREQHPLASESARRQAYQSVIREAGAQAAQYNAARPRSTRTSVAK